MWTQKDKTDAMELIVAYRSFAKSNHYLKDTEAITTHIPVESTRLLRSTLFWALTQRIGVFPYRRLGITYRSHLEVLTLDNGTKRLYRNVDKELPLYAN